jgi:outer membrane autotransporter protein
LTFTTPVTFNGMVVVTFTLKTANSTTPPATVTFIVVPRRDPSQDPDVIGLINAQIAAAERFANAQMMNLNQRLESLHEDGYGQDRQGITGGSNEQAPYGYAADPFGKPPGSSANADQSRSPSAAMIDRMITKGEPKSPDPVGPMGPRRDFSFWSSGYVNFGSNDSIPGSAFDFTTSGVTVGADYRFNPLFTAGIGFGYGRDNTTINVDGTLSRAQTYSLSLYETYRPFKGVYVDGILGFGTLRFDSQRFIVDDGDFAFGSRTGNEWFGSLTAGYEYRNGHLLLSPYARLKGVWITLDSFSEFGDPTDSLTFARQSVDTITGVLGLRGKYDILMGWGVISPRFRVEYNHGFQSGGLAALGFADLIGGPTFFVPTSATTSDFAAIGIGTDVKFPNDMFINFDYQTTINAFDTHSHMFQVRAGVRF